MVVVSKQVCGDFFYSREKEKSVIFLFFLVM